MSSWFEHAKLDGEKPARPQPYKKNYRQLTKDRN